METIDLDNLILADLKPSPSLKGMEFDTGIELLMNDKKINKQMSMDSGSAPLGRFDTSASLNQGSASLNQGSASLNQGSASLNEVFTPSTNTKTINGGWFGNLFNSNSSEPVSTSNQDQGVQNVGQATVESLGTAKTWDGYSSKLGVSTSQPILLSSLNDRERKNKKRMMIKYLEKMNQDGKIQNTPSFNIDTSPFEDVEDEFLAVRDDDKREASIKFQGECLKQFMFGVEKLNNFYSPFGVDLTGLSSGIEMSMSTFEPEFYEIHDMYLKNMPINPIVSLVFKICAATLMVGPAYAVFANANPGLAEIIQSSPEIKQMIMQQGMRHGFQMFKSDYNTEMGNLERKYAPPVVNRDPPPPAPIETRVNPPSYNNRPDIAEARRGQGPSAHHLDRSSLPSVEKFSQSPLGEMFQNRRESGVNLDGYVSAQAAPNTPSFGKMNFTHEPARQSSVPMYQYQQNPQTQAKPRAEMKGPSPEFNDFFSNMQNPQLQDNFQVQPQDNFQVQPQDTFQVQSQNTFHGQPHNTFQGQPQDTFQGQPQDTFQGQPRQDTSLELDDLISGLKPKIQDAFQFQNREQSPPRKNQQRDIRDDESVFSNDSIRHLGNTRMPKSSSTKRRQRSDKNVVSLDL